MHSLCVCLFIALFVCLPPHVSPISMVIAVRSSWYTDQCGVGAQSACTSPGKSKTALGLDLSKDLGWLLFFMYYFHHCRCVHVYNQPAVAESCSLLIVKFWSIVFVVCLAFEVSLVWMYVLYVYGIDAVMFFPYTVYLSQVFIFNLSCSSLSIIQCSSSVTRAITSGTFQYLQAHCPKTKPTIFITV